jgi:ABC-type nickel/cobalt efflux system permease component RcnA
MWFCVLSLIVLGAQPVCAHPLGNFTINHLAKITTVRDALRVHYVLDIAEIPTFQIMQDAGGKWTPGAAAQWAQSEIPRVQDGLQILVDGTPVRLQPVGVPQQHLRPGAGGLSILYWTANFTAPLQGGVAHKIVVSDSVYADRRIGWKDIVVGKQTEPTRELRHYPSALIGTPRRTTSASFKLAAGGAVSSIVDSEDAHPQIASSAPWLFDPMILSGMFSRQNQTPMWVLITILAAFGLGALHAIEPGHGKALLAFTLVGSRATSKQALILAASLTFAHTIGVLILGVVLLTATKFVSETIYPWITLLSGVAIAFIGARALGRFVQARRALTHGHEHTHDGARPHLHEHDHDHAHDAAHGHGHSHEIPGSRPLNFGNAVWAAMSGGVAPCPAAIVVMLTALRLHQLGYGLLLIVVFSMGLAAVLSGLGIGVVHGASWLSRRSKFEQLVTLGPLLSSTVISIIGAAMVGSGFVQVGFASSAVIIAMLVFAAIAGYALAQHGHTHHHHAQAPEATA